MSEQEFKAHVFARLQYDAVMLEQFFDYWSEPNKKGKMRWELEKTWDLDRRLKRWHHNQIEWYSKNSQNVKQQSTTIQSGKGFSREGIQAELNKRLNQWQQTRN